ncbi:MAG: hypothetical protein DRI95_15770, partial [Bacteroidetes bacterium]
VSGSITNKQSLSNLFKDVDYVFHLAAIISIGKNSKENIFKVNIEGTKNVIELCEQYSIKKLIHFSSVHALEQNKQSSKIDENTPLANNKAFIYDQSKAEAERLIIEAVDRGLNAIILNPTSVVGPDDYVPSLVGQMILKLSSNKLPFIIKGGYNWVDVRDIIETAINALEKGRSGERYLLSGEWKSLNEVAHFITKEAGSKPPIIIPLFLARIGLPFIKIYSWLSKKDPLYTNEALSIVSQPSVQIVNSKAKKELGFRNRPAKESFIDAYNWFKQNNYTN